MSINEKPTISLDDDSFCAVLNCAVRYALGRQSYMPGVVIKFITPLLPYLSNRTLWCFDQDVTDARWYGGYGDPQIDEPRWIKFLMMFAMKEYPVERHPMCPTESSRR